jgi:L,D-peptidoglycan transpeptidase YkuD (ErfK/YbiS/YcfS/YnhG family)
MIALAVLAVACTNALAAPAPARQLVTVEAASTAATDATVRLWQRGADGCWTAAGGPWAARVGRNGLSSHHREGDGTTPLGTFAFGSVVYGVAPDPGVRLAYHRLVCGDWWNEDPRTAGYNTFRHVPCGTSPPFGGDSEALWRAVRAYSHFAVIRYNVAPAVAGRGSAIFLHADTGRATNGCVSLPSAQLVRVLRWLDPAERPAIAIRVR